MKFFVSYSRSVQDQVREIIASLRDSGDEVWWDQDLRAGQDWWGTILNNIEACEVCLFMISEKSVLSPYCMEELRYALDRNRLVLPYVMDAPVSYTLPPEILQGRIQYEAYNGIPSQLKQRIRVACQGVDWTQYRNRYTARPAEPNTEANDLVDRLDKAAALANEGHFDEAIKRFKDVSRNDPESYGDFCHTWIEKIKRYQDVVKHANAPALKSLAKQRWDAFLQQFTGDDFFDPLDLQAKFDVVETPKKRTGLLTALNTGQNSYNVEMSAEAYLLRGKSRPAEDSDGKISDYAEAIRLNPYLAEAYSRRGANYEIKGEHDRAITDYTEAIRLNPQLAEAYNNRGISYAAKGEHDRALVDYSESIRLNPQYANAYYERGRSYTAMRDYDRAIADYTEAIRLNPQDTFAYDSRARHYSAKGAHEQAIADYSEIIRLNPHSDTAYYNRARSYKAKGDIDRSTVDYTEALRLNPNFAEVYTRRGTNYDLKREHDRAIADHTEALRCNPQYAEAYNNRGNSYAAKGVHDRAIADYNEAIRLNPKNPLAFNNRGVSYLAKKDYDRAIADFDMALSIDSHFELAVSNRQLTLDAKKQGR